MIDAKIGDTIKVSETLHGFDDTCNRKEHTYTITAIYPHMVLAECKGIRRCFNYGDLIRLGIQKQEDVYEALRGERDYNWNIGRARKEDFSEG